MTKTHSNTAILRQVKTNRFYRHIDGDRFENLYTGDSGVVPPDQAQRIFKINLEATAIFNEYPIVEELVRRLKLVADEKINT